MRSVRTRESLGLRRGLAAAALLAVLAPSGATADRPAPQSAARVGWQPVDLVYEVYAGGLHVFTVDMNVALRDAGYDLDLALRTDGTLAWFVAWRMTSLADGRPEAASPVPARFRTDSLGRGNERWVELRYDGAGPPQVAAEPSADEDDRDPVPDDLRLDTVDPLSAGLALIYSLAWTDGCELSLGVFDGRRRFNARSRDDGEREIAVGDLSPYGGLARACAVTVEPVTGFWRSAEGKYRARTEDFTVFLRQVTPETPPLPVRIEADTRFGAVRVHLVQLATPKPS